MFLRGKHDREIIVIYSICCKKVACNLNHIPSFIVLSFQSSVVGVGIAFFDNWWVSFWNKTLWHWHWCKNQSTRALQYLVHTQLSNKKRKICHGSFKLCNEKWCQLPSGYCTDHKARPWLCDVFWERVEMTHSSATYTAVNDYDNSRAALHKQLCGAALIIPDSLSHFLYSPHSPSFSFSSCLTSLSPCLHVFLSFPVSANHTQEGYCCWILIFIYTATLWCPPSPPQCSVSTSLSPALPALPAQNISLCTLRFECVCVYWL